jgi:ubiquinone/menaquinone biosynthesis C-methylase UbiE
MLARVYDVVMMPGERRGLRTQRSRMCRLAAGRVLEVAVGTGLNLSHYERADMVVGVDHDPAMLRRAERKRHGAMMPVRLVEADARELPFRDGTFSTVVIGLALCTIPNPDIALEEARRVAAAEAELHFLEHVRSPRRVFGALEDALAPAWRRIAGGCRPNQDTVSIIEDSGWAISSLWRSPRGGLVQGRALRQ